MDWAEATEFLDIANGFDIAVYDAAYVFLSEKLEAPFISSETKLVKKTKDHFQIINLKIYV